jgi:hypothetical protein
MSAMNEALETLINGKADSATTYTKSQVDTLLTDKANTDDVYSKNTMDAKLLEYAPSESVYSKQDINTMKQVNKANLAIVSTDGLAPLDIAAGQYVYFNDVMYMATEEILQGVQLVPNANIVINPTGVTNRIGDGLKNAVTQINGLAETVNSQSQQIDDLKAAAAYVEDGDTATKKTYAAGEFIVWKGSLYTVNSGGLPLGTAITGHVTAVTGGGLNVINDGLNALNNNLGNVQIVRVSKLISIPAGPSTTSVDLSEYIPSGKGIVSISSVALGEYILPYIDNSVIKTSISVVHFNDNKIDIYNTSTAWNNFTLHIVLFIA